jgi:RHS repeat-associated protein
MNCQKLLQNLLLIISCIVAGNGKILAQDANNRYTIGTQNGVYHYNYNQTPSPLIEIYPPGFPNVSFTYQWEQCATPTGNFQPIPGATGSSYSFAQPLTQTMYIRRKASNWIFTRYSNVVKLQLVSAQWEDLNYVREHDIRVKGVTTWQAADALPIGQKQQTTTYMDGLGRTLQQVSRETATPANGSSLWGDVVQFAEYDAMGRQPKQFLPYTTTSQSGKYKTAPKTEQETYYTAIYNETAAFSAIVFDNSPLNRIKNLKEPGTAWAASAGKSADYELNGIADNVQNFSVDYITGNPPLRLGVYDPNTLYKQVTADEKGKQVIEYTNKSGQLILRKVQLEDNPSAAHSGWICTYSIYDDFGQLRYQLQPEAVKYLDANGWSFAGTNGQKVLNDLCFQYAYDEKGRTTWKKAPGAEPLRMLYDKRDRVVFMQDGNQAAKNPPEWTATLYDELDRPTITTLYRTTKSVTDLQTAINNAGNVTTTANVLHPTIDIVKNNRETNISRYAAQNSIEFLDGFESVTNDEFVAEIDPLAGTNHTVTTTGMVDPIPVSELNNPSICTILKYQYYDTYAFTGVKGFDAAYDNAAAYSTGDVNVLPIAATRRTINHPTGSKVRVLGTNTFLLTTAYYGEQGQLIQTTEENIKGGQDVTTLQYHFDGRLLSSHTKHTTAGTGYTNFSILTKNEFDKIGRVTTVQKKYGTNDWKAIASYAYDDVGRLKNKRLAPGYTGTGKTELESLAYSYNIHNNITGINKDYALKTSGKYEKWGHFFGLYLGYDNRDGVFNGANLGGQVTGLLWNTQGDDAQRKYDYTYDNAGRLLTAVFNEKKTAGDAWSNSQMDFSVTGNGGRIGYDLNGNLLSMLQKGVLPGGGAPVTVDDLQYAYASYSNKLLKVTDNSTLGANNGKQGDFKDGTNGTGDDYVYDANGNVVIDLNKGAKELANVPGAHGIRYNHLDKPEEIRIAGKGTIKLVYDASGTKLQKLYTPEGSSTTTTTSYINGFVYNGDNLQYIHFEEGRIRVMQPIASSNGYDAVAIDGNLTLPGGKQGAYDYYIRDYQENVRMILTEETHLGSNQCTMETARAGQEEPFFGQSGAGNEVASTRFAVNSIPGAGWQHADIGSHVSRLGNLAGKKTGPNSLLKVMAGDVVTATTQYYYKDPVVNGTGNNLVNDVLTTLVQTITGSAATNSVTKGAVSNISGDLTPNIPFNSVVAPDAANPSGTAPKAYLTVLFFDERFRFVGEGSTSLRVQENPGNNASLTLPNIKAPKNGYCYVYVSNESNEPVYFDNLRVGHNRGRIIEENHYYSYGLKIAAISSQKLGNPAEGLLANQHLYNDKELIEEADLGWYDYGFRMYDAQIGRFPQLDPLTDDYPYLTPYQYASNDPITNIDIDGLEGGSAVGASFSYSYKAASQADIFLTPANIISKTATVTRPAGSLLLVTKSAAVGGAAVASSANPLRVAAKQGVQQVTKQGAKVIAMNTAKSPGFWSKALPWAARSLNVAGWVLTPLDAGPRAPGGNELYYYPGHPGYSPKFAPVPENNPKGRPDDNDGDDYVTLYRGVHKKHPGFNEAKRGVATPYGGSDDVDAHNGGNFFTNFTSWSYSKGVAQYHANKKGSGGVILTRKFKKSEMVASPDHFNELEVLIKGKVSGAKVEYAQPGGTPSVF